MTETTATIISKKSLTHDVLEFVFKPEQPISYKEGQYVMIKIPSGEKFQYRAYSLANHSGDREKGLVRIIIKLLDKGAASEYLKTKKAGDQIVFRGGLGFFTFKSQNVDNIYFIGTGTGLAPLVAILNEELSAGNKSKFHLIWGNRFRVDIYWDELLADYKARYPNFTYEIILSKPVGYWQGAKGYVTDLLKNETLDFAAGHFYLCGHPKMVEDAKVILMDKGVEKNRIFEEKYVSVGLSQR